MNNIFIKDVWSDHIFPNLEMKDRIPLREVSKEANEGFLQLSNHEAKNYKVKIPDESIPLFSSMVKGTLQTHYEIIEQYDMTQGDPYFSGSKDYPLIKTNAVNLNRRVLCKCFPLDSQKLPEDSKKAEKIKDDIRTRSKLKSDFPSYLPFECLTNIKDQETVIFKWDNRLFELKTEEGFEKHIKEIISINNSLRLHTVPKTKDTSKYIDLDVIKDEFFVKNNPKT